MTVRRRARAQRTRMGIPTGRDRRFWAVVPYVVIMIPTLAALVLTFQGSGA
jgi:hypothetical protein